MKQPPAITCRPIQPFNLHDWAAIHDAFEGAEKLTLSQPWRQPPDPGFLPATVQAGWIDNTSGGDLWLYARLQDADIFNSATSPNDKTWTTGDVLEIFLRPLPDEPYFEFHVTPENQQLQLRFPSSHAFFNAGSDPDVSFDKMLLWDPLMESRTLVLPGDRHWSIVARISGTIAPGRKIAVGDQWLFSWSRYDYTRGEKETVTSSSSPHEAGNFHLQSEWGTLTFAA